jgi:hypothetical protein
VCVVLYPQDEQPQQHFIELTPPSHLGNSNPRNNNSRIAPAFPSTRQCVRKERLVSAPVFYTFATFPQTRVCIRISRS